MVVAVSFLLLISACSPTNSTENKTDTIADSANAKTNKSSEVVELTGLYANHLFISCLNSNDKITLNEGVQKLDSLYKSVLPNPAYPEQTVFADVKGVLTSSNGVTSLAIKEVIHVEQKSFKNTCIPYDYWCTGTEPFWQIQISEKEHLIDFYDPMIPKFYHFNFSKPEIKNGITSYISSNNENKISISIKKEKCNGAIDTPYNYSVEVVLNDKKYSGCAIKYGE